MNFAIETMDFVVIPRTGRRNTKVLSTIVRAASAKINDRGGQTVVADHVPRETQVYHPMNVKDAGHENQSRALHYLIDFFKLTSCSRFGTSALRFAPRKGR